MIRSHYLETAAQAMFDLLIERGFAGEAMEGTVIHEVDPGVIDFLYPGTALPVPTIGTAMVVIDGCVDGDHGDGGAVRTIYDVCGVHLSAILAGRSSEEHLQ